jgi:hypothetical protein
MPDDFADHLSAAEYRALRRGRGNKYRARKRVLDGIRFDSIRESERYRELALLQKAGRIRELKIHPQYTLAVHGEVVSVYAADFEYIEATHDAEACPTPQYHAEHGKLVVEDVKSRPTASRQDYRIKKALMRALYGIEIKEVF